jgi:hypothetical protein
MARKDRTRVRPYIELGHHGWKGFDWDLVLHIGSAGYIQRVTANACHHDDGTESYGSAWVDIELGDDVQLAVETCVVESAATAATPSLFTAEPSVKHLSRLEVFGR